MLQLKRISGDKPRFLRELNRMRPPLCVELVEQPVGMRRASETCQALGLRLIPCFDLELFPETLGFSEPFELEGHGIDGALKLRDPRIFDLR